MARWVWEDVHEVRRGRSPATLAGFCHAETGFRRELVPPAHRDVAEPDVRRLLFVQVRALWGRIWADFFATSPLGFGLVFPTSPGRPQGSAAELVPRLADAYTGGDVARRRRSFCSEVAASTACPAPQRGARPAQQSPCRMRQARAAERERRAVLAEQGVDIDTWAPAEAPGPSTSLSPPFWRSQSEGGAQHRHTTHAAVLMRRSEANVAPPPGVAPAGIVCSRRDPRSRISTEQRPQVEIKRMASGGELASSDAPHDHCLRRVAVCRLHRFS